MYHTISYVSTFVLSNFTFFDPFSYDTITFRKLHLWNYLMKIYSPTPSNPLLGLFLPLKNNWSALGKVMEEKVKRVNCFLKISDYPPFLQNIIFFVTSSFLFIFSFLSLYYPPRCHNGGLILITKGCHFAYCWLWIFMLVSTHEYVVPTSICAYLIIYFYQVCIVNTLNANGC